MSRVAGVRKILKIPTIFNILGPLSNPVEPDYQLIGVYSPHLCKILAESMLMLGIRGIVVHGSGLDEVSIAEATQVYEVRNCVDSYAIQPEDFGFERRKLTEVAGGDSRYNKRVILDAFSNKEGPIRDFILINAGMALYAAERVQSIEDGIEACRHGFEDGTVLKHVKRVMAYYRRLRCGRV
jgi:anthranilate phosphoribosyltransferase